MRLWFGVLLALSACAGDDAGSAGQGGSAGQASGGSSGAPSGGDGGGSGADASGGASGASASGGTSGTSGSGGVSGASATGGTGGAAASDSQQDAATGEVGVCGQRGMGTVSLTSFEGYEELYLIGDNGFGDDLCVVRLDATRVDTAPPEGCGDPTADAECLWVHTVELTDPVVMTDVDGACASSSLGLDADALAALDGTRATYGFVSEFAGHNGVVLRYEEASSDWPPFGNGTWDEEAESFRFDHRDGLCDY